MSEKWIYSDGWRFAAYIASILFGLLLVIVAITGGLYWIIEPLNCEARGFGMNLNHKWDFWGGCFLEVDNRWIHETLVRFPQ